MSAATHRKRSSLSWRATAGSLLAGLLLCGFGIFRFPLTRSLPRGLYLALPARSLAGDIVSFCPEPGLARRLRALRLVGPGICPGDALPLAKRVAAVAPHVCARLDGIYIDRRRLSWPVFPPTVFLERYSRCGPTPPDCLFVLGDSSDSIDSRTFGCVPRSSVINRIVPLLTEGL